MPQPEGRARRESPPSDPRTLSERRATRPRSGFSEERRQPSGGTVLGEWDAPATTRFAGAWPTNRTLERYGRGDERSDGRLVHPVEASHIRQESIKEFRVLRAEGSQASCVIFDRSEEHTS